MDQSEDQNFQSADHKFNSYRFLRRTLQFVFSVSVFSFFLWCSSGFSIVPDQSFNVYFSTFLFSMITHTFERKYMFLICNGILAFLAKSSITSSPSISANFNLEFQASSLPETRAPVSEDFVPLALGTYESPEDAPVIVEEELEQAKKHEGYEEEAAEVQVGTLYTEMEGRKNEASIAEEDEEGTGSEMMVAQDDEADTTTAINEELVNTDELNRKFEEFIRKMKEEIRIEAQRQLIAV